MDDTRTPLDAGACGECTAPTRDPWFDRPSALARRLGVLQALAHLQANARDATTTGLGDTAAPPAYADLASVLPQVRRPNELQRLRQNPDRDAACAWRNPLEQGNGSRTVVEEPGLDDPLDPPREPYQDPTIRHEPRYPRSSRGDDVNIALRRTTEDVVIVRVKPGGTQAKWPPDEVAAQGLRMALDDLWKTNAYEMASRLQFQTNGASLVFDVDVQAPNYAVDGFDIPTLLRTISRFHQLYPNSPRLETIDHVVLFVPRWGSAAPSRTVQYIIFQDNLTAGLAPNQVAAAVFHEMGHGYSLGHANLEQPVIFTAAGFLEYGDIYDYMGGMTNAQWRFNSGCHPPASAGFKGFAAPTDIHLNPIHKWQHGWLPDASLATPREGTLSAPNTWHHDIHPLAAPSGVRAVLINLRYAIGRTGAVIPESLLVYWRQNEPQVKDGASVAIVSRELLSLPTKLLETQAGPAISCSAPNPWPTFPGFHVTIRAGGTLTMKDQRGNDITIAVPSGWDPSTAVTLPVDITLPARPFVFRNIPIVDVSSTAVEAQKVITNKDILRVEVDAAVPNETHAAWFQIRDVVAEFRIGDGMSNRPLFFRGTRKPAEKFFRTGTEVWRVAARDLEDGLNPMQPMRTVVNLTVTATSRVVDPDLGQETEIRGARVFLLDQLAGGS